MIVLLQLCWLCYWTYKNLISELNVRLKLRKLVWLGQPKQRAWKHEAWWTVDCGGFKSLAALILGLRRVEPVPAD
jgi:hypothetical protein